MRLRSKLLLSHLPVKNAKLRPGKSRGAGIPASSSERASDNFPR